MGRTLSPDHPTASTAADIYSLGALLKALLLRPLLPNAPQLDVKTLSQPYMSWQVGVIYNI